VIRGHSSHWATEPEKKANSSIFSRTLQVENHHSVNKLFIGFKQEKFGNMAEIKHVGAAVSVCICGQEGIKGKLNKGKFC
jgi:hypothetical protein